MTHRERKRQEIIEAGTGFLLDNGLYEFSLRPFAHYLDTSDRMVLHYFKDKDELLYELLSHLMEKTLGAVAADSTQKLPVEAFVDIIPILAGDESNKKFFRLWIELCGYSATRMPLSEDFTDRIFDMFKSWLRSKINFGSAADQEGLLSLLIIHIEGSIVVGSYNKTGLVRQAALYLKHLMAGTPLPVKRETETR